MIGNYGEARIVVRKTNQGWINGIYDRYEDYLFDKEMPTLNVTQDFYVSAIAAWSTRILFAEVVSMKNDTSLNTYTR